jgi:glc operon protein GlcG
MTHHQVTDILKAAIASAETQNIQIAVSIVDKSGYLMGFMRTTDCSFAAIEVSKKKAATACAFGMPTDAIGELIQTHPFMEKAFASFTDIFYFGGGLPIVLDHKIVGGIGVSGANPVQDKEIAVKSVEKLA